MLNYCLLTNLSLAVGNVYFYKMRSPKPYTLGLDSLTTMSVLDGFGIRVNFL